MFRPLALNIGLRYARSRRNFVSFVNALALGGLALSVATLLFVQAVVAGFERELEQRVLGVVAHLTVVGHAPVADPAVAAGVLADLPGVQAVSAVTDGVGLLTSGNGVVGVGLTGIEPAEYAAVSRLFDFTTGARTLTAGAFQVLIGKRAAERLGVDVGDSVTAVLPDAVVTPLGVFPRQKRLRVAGRIDTGSQLDQHSAYMHRADAAKLFRLGDAAHGFHVRLAAPLEAAPVRVAAQRALGAHRFRVHSWPQALGDLSGAIGAARNILFLLLSLLVLVAAFNLVSSLVMIVAERRGDVAMLRTIGAGSSLVLGAFVILGAVIAVVGIGLGVAGGIALGALAEWGFPWLERLLATPLMGEYFVDALPVRFTGRDIVQVVATAFALCLLATLAPAWRAARLRPADVLQHE